METTTQTTQPVAPTVPELIERFRLHLSDDAVEWLYELVGSNYSLSEIVSLACREELCAFARSVGLSAQAATLETAGEVLLWTSPEIEAYGSRRDAYNDARRALETAVLVFVLAPSEVVCQ